MVAMTLASLGWGTWWLVLLLWRIDPHWVPPEAVPDTISTVFALLGLMVALATIRKGKGWLLFASVPLVANGSLLLVPWLAAELVSKTP